MVVLVTGIKKPKRGNCGGSKSSLEKAISARRNKVLERIIQLMHTAEPNMSTGKKGRGRWWLARAHSRMARSG